MWLIFRECIGWVLVLLGLALIGFVVNMALNRNVLEAVAVSIPATIVFRSGVAFVKLAVAGRIAGRIAREEVQTRS